MERQTCVYGSFQFITLPAYPESRKILLTRSKLAKPHQPEELSITLKDMTGYAAKLQQRGSCLFSYQSLRSDQ
jgi:hypothetical protein